MCAMIMSLFAMCLSSLCIAAAALGLSPQQKSFTVIGGGVAGLVTANLLARDGHNITVIERRGSIGGRMGSGYQRSHYRFDTGPSLLLLPKVYRDTLSAIGVRGDRLELVEVTSPQYRVFFDSDGTCADISRDQDEMRGTLEGIRQGAYDGYRRYMSIAASYLNFGLPFVIEEEYRQASFGLFTDFIKGCLSMFPLLSHQFMLEMFFGRGEGKLHSMFSFQDLYIGLSPYESPAVFSLLQSLELVGGVYYPKGGFERVAELLSEANDINGVRVEYNTSLVGYDSDSSGGISGAVVRHADGREVVIKSDYYVTNIDTPHHDDEFCDGGSDGDYGRRPSCGVISINLALSKRLGALAHHNIFCASDRRLSWRFLETDHVYSGGGFDVDNSNFYVHCPERSDPTACPAGHDAITVLVPVPPLPNPTPDGGEEAVEQALLIQRVRARVVERLAAVSGMTAAELEELVCGEEITSPADWRARYGLYRGQAFGLAHSVSQLSFLRARFQSSRFRNLFRVGASTRPGNGVPLVMIGARLCHKHISKVVAAAGK